MTASPVDAYTEVEARRILARRSPGDFAVVANGYQKADDGAMRQKWVLARHLRLISSEIAPCIERPIRLIITAPPRHGKSELSSRATPAWVLGHRPDWRVALGSYSDAFAQEHGDGALQLAMKSEQLGLFPDFHVRTDRGGAGRWYTTSGGGMISVGMRGSLTGRGANVLIIDDPIKDAEQAQSDVHRDKTWNWFTSTAYTRLEPGGSIIILLTRWHEDDIVGRLLADPDMAAEFMVINLPALPEHQDMPDPLGRVVDEPLWPERFPFEVLDKIRTFQRKSGNWDSMYQGRPAPADGKIFKRGDEREWQAIVNDADEAVYNLGAGRLLRPSECARIFMCDPALTDDQANDPTVIQCWDIAPNADMVLVDQFRDWIESIDILPELKRWYERLKPELIGVEKASFGLSIIQQARRDGLPIIELEADKDKVARATTAATKMKSNQVFFEHGAKYVPGLLYECRIFPNGTHDDQVDCFAYAAVEAQKRAFNWGDAWGIHECEGCGHKYVRKPADRPCPKCHTRPL